MKDKSKNLVSIILALTIACFVAALLSMNYVPPRYKLIAFLSVIAITMLILMLTHKKLWRLTLSLSILIVACGLIVSQWMVNRLGDFKDHEIVEYVVIEAKSKGHTETNHDMGFYGAKFEDTKMALTDLESSYLERKITPYVNAEDILYDLKNGYIESVLTQTSVLSDLKFFDESFDDWTREVDRFVLNEARQDITKPVDVMKEPFMVYVSGIDVFGDVVTRSRSDLNLVFVVNPQTRKILTVTMPRDTYVPLGCENGAMDKLTHAGLYGVNCSVKTVENLLGIDINYYLRLNFTSLVDIVDAIDGVDVYSHYDFTTDGGDEFVKGMNHVDGRKALVFARERTNIDYGDVSRGMHHQELAKAIFSKIISADRLTQLPQLSNMMQRSVDMNFTSEDISNLIAMQIDNNEPWEIEDISLEGVGDMDVVHSLDSQYMFYVFKYDKDSVATIKERIRDTMKPLESGADS